MNLLKKILLGFFSGLVLIFLLSLFLPSKYEIVRTKTVKCDSKQVYDYLSDIKHLDEWFYITGSLDSTLIYTPIKSSDGLNNAIEWNGELMGQGTFEYIKKNDNKEIDFKLSFQENTVFKNGKIEIRGINNGTEIKWTDYGENGWNPVNRIFGLFIDGFLGPDMERSLNKIQTNLDC
jgi:hypothetical protein